MNDRAKARHLVLKLNQLRVEADIEHIERNAVWERILRELIEGTLPSDQEGPSPE